MNRINQILVASLIGCLLPITATGAIARPSEQNSFDQELQKIKYSYALALSDDKNLFYARAEFDSDDNSSRNVSKSGYKSPSKAFLLSLALPGLGQYYYGSRIKPVAFLGVEAFAWLMRGKWNSEGTDLTAEFEQFNRNHWSQMRYEEYLFIVYEVMDDDSVTAQEASHHLPDTRTQQYYEMTGKYDQFSWGWDDADLNGQVYADWNTNPPIAVIGDTTVPTSARRLLYETMRFDANKKFDKANKMLMMVFANHLISAVEAFLSTKKRNESNSFDPEFSRLNVETNIKSTYGWRDTPYLSVGYKF